MRIEDPVLIFAAIMLIMLAAPILFNRFRVPGLIGLIVAGMAAGPHALGLFALDGTFELLGKVGLLYLMFLAGLEIEFNEFARHRRDSVIFGLLTFLIPQVAGTLGARALFGFSWPTCVLLASMFASHTLIPFPIVTRLGITRNRAVATTVGGTILTDTAALLVLAVIAESTTATLSTWFWVRQGGLLVALVWFGLWALPRIGYWFFRVTSPDETTEFIFMISAVFATSYIASLCGVEPIIGAFLAGLSLNRLVPASSPLMNRLEFVGHALFIPFFLISVGMRVDLRVALLEWRSWAVSAYMVLAVIATKGLAAAWSGRLLGYSPDERRVMFGLSVNQAAATLAAVLVGQRIGLFDDNILNGTILMILVTCMLGPWMTQRHGERLALAADGAEAGGGPAPARVMVPLSHPDTADALMDLALLLRGRTATEPIYPLTIVQDGVDVEARVEVGEKTLGRAVARASAAGAPVTPVTHIDVTIGGGITRAIKEYRIATVVMGWSPRYARPASLLHWLPQDILDQSRALLALAHTRRPLGAYQRGLLVAPPLIERTPGFAEAMRAALTLSSLSEMHLFACAETLEALRPMVLKSRAAAPPVEHTLPHRGGAMLALDRLQPGQQDLIVLLGARRGRAGWQPQIDRLPGQIADRFPEADFIILHPPVPEDPAHAVVEDASFAESAGCLPAPDRILTGVEETDLTALIARMIAPAFADAPPIAAAVARRIAGHEPVELAPGIALLHGHIPELAAPAAFLAVAQSTLPMAGMERPRVRCSSCSAPPISRPRSTCTPWPRSPAPCARNHSATSSRTTPPPRPSSPP
jgi:Kef-type K+ transport system membrane component KefB